MHLHLAGFLIACTRFILVYACINYVHPSAEREEEKGFRTKSDPHIPMLTEYRAEVTEKERTVKERGREGAQWINHSHAGMAYHSIQVLSIIHTGTIARIQ